MSKKFKKVVEWKFNEKEFDEFIIGSYIIIFVIWITTLAKWYLGLAMVIVMILAIRFAMIPQFRKPYWVEVKK